MLASLPPPHTRDLPSQQMSKMWRPTPQTHLLQPQATRVRFLSLRGAYPRRPQPFQGRRTTLWTGGTPSGRDHRTSPHLYCARRIRSATGTCLPPPCSSLLRASSHARRQTPPRRGLCVPKVAATLLTSHRRRCRCVWILRRRFALPQQTRAVDPAVAAAYRSCLRLKRSSNVAVRRSRWRVAKPRPRQRGHQTRGRRAANAAAQHHSNCPRRCHRQFQPWWSRRRLHCHLPPRAVCLLQSQPCLRWEAQDRLRQRPPYRPNRARAHSVVGGML